MFFRAYLYGGEPFFMSFNEILTELYLSAELNDCINKFVPDHYREDFKQDLFVYLAENEQRVTEMYGRQELKFFLARIIINVPKNKYGWAKQYTNSEQLPEVLPEKPDSFDVNERLLFEQKEAAMIAEIDNLDSVMNSPFYRGVIKALEKYGSQRKASEQTEIPRNTINRAVKKVREHLKDKFK